MKQTIQLSDHFGYRRLIRFTVPSILTMIITSIYGVVDGFFISNFVGKTPFAAVNFCLLLPRSGVRYQIVHIFTGSVTSTRILMSLL